MPSLVSFPLKNDRQPSVYVKTDAKNHTLVSATLNQSSNLISSASPIEGFDAAVEDLQYIKRICGNKKIVEKCVKDFESALTDLSDLMVNIRAVRVAMTPVDKIPD